MRRREVFTSNKKTLSRHKNVRARCCPCLKKQLRRLFFLKRATLLPETHKIENGPSAEPVCYPKSIRFRNVTDANNYNTILKKNCRHKLLIYFSYIFIIRINVVMQFLNVFSAFAVLSKDNRKSQIRRNLDDLHNLL